MHGRAADTNRFASSSSSSKRSCDFFGVGGEFQFQIQFQTWWRFFGVGGSSSSRSSSVQRLTGQLTACFRYISSGAKKYRPDLVLSNLSVRFQKRSKMYIERERERDPQIDEKWIPTKSNLGNHFYIILYLLLGTTITSGRDSGRPCGRPISPVRLWRSTNLLQSFGRTFCCSQHDLLIERQICAKLQ